MNMVNRFIGGNTYKNAIESGHSTAYARGVSLLATFMPITVRSLTQLDKQKTKSTVDKYAKPLLLLFGVIADTLFNMFLLAEALSPNIAVSLPALGMIKIAANTVVNNFLYIT